MASQKQNEWVCRYCDTHNEAYRVQCKTCGQPKPGSNNQKILIVVLVCIIVLLAGILIGTLLTGKSSSTSEPKPTTEVTATPAPTSTPKPTETAEPTTTPKPTETTEPATTPKPTSTPKPTVAPTSSANTTQTPTAAPKSTPVPKQESYSKPAAEEPTPPPTEAPYIADGWLTDYGKSIHSGIDYSHNEKMNIIVDAYYSRGKKEDGFTPGYYEKLARGAWQGYDVSLYFADKELYFVTVRGWGRLYYWNGEIISFKADSETENENSLDYIRFMFDGLYEIAMTYAK